MLHHIHPTPFLTLCWVILRVPNEMLNYFEKNYVFHNLLKQKSTFFLFPRLCFLWRHLLTNLVVE